jgi:glycosyltransferase involved in cell wall biosynthesis
MVAKFLQCNVVFRGAKVGDMFASQLQSAPFGLQGKKHLKIAIFDYLIVRNNAIGSCHLRMLKALCLEHEFTVFAVEFQNPCPERIRWVRVPAIKRPLALLFITFHLLAPFLYWWHRLRHRTRFDHVQMVESNLLFGDISYSHSCHRLFLDRYWKNIGAQGPRGALRWLDHWLHARIEPWVYRRASHIVVPSRGFARELAETYPFASSKIQVLANSVDTKALRRPEDFDRDGFRKVVGLAPRDIVLAFVALGHYELKGLPLLLEALARNGDPRLRVMVVGGSHGLIAEYRKRATRIGLNGNVTFVGTQKDVRPYLWASDALAHPSRHEVFPLVTLEAAAAGLPLLVTPLNGVEEFLREGQNGMLMQCNVSAVSDCIVRFAQMPGEDRNAMGQRAQADVQRYSPSHFASAWAQFYRELR